MSYSEDMPSCSSVAPRREVELKSLWQDPSFCRLGIDKNINICPQLSSRKQNRLQDQVNSRTKALNIVHNQMVALEVCYQRDVCELQRKYYAGILRPLQDLRSSLLALVTEGNEKPTSSEIVQKIHNTTMFSPTSNSYKRLVKHLQVLLSAGPSLKETGFTDTFWLEVMLNADSITQKVIRETDKEVLSYLVDVNCDIIKSCGASSPVEEEGYGFQVSFKFEANPFFHNRKLVKRYMIDIYPREREEANTSNHGDESLMESDNLLRYSGPRLVEITGSKIIWKTKDETDKELEHLKAKSEGDACLSSMLDYFEFNWMETTGKHSGAAEYDFLIGTYFRDILVTNAYGMYHRKFRYSAAQSETCMTSAKSCSATELGNTFDQNRDFPAIQNSRSLTSRSNLCNQPYLATVAKSPLSVKNNSNIFSLLQRGHATKLNILNKNHTTERINQLIATPRRNSVNERLSRKRAFSEWDFPGERELRFPYKIMSLSPTMTKRDKSKTKESIISGTTYDPISSCHLAQTVIKTQNNHSHSFSSTPKLGLMARAAIGVESVRQDLPQSSTGGSRQRLSDSDNAFNKLLRQLDQLKGENPAQFSLLDFTVPAYSKIPRPSCGIWNDSDEDEEKGWEDVSEDLTTPVVESKVLDVSGEARCSYQHQVEKPQSEATAPKRKLVKLTLKAARKIAAANKKAPLVPPTKKTTRQKAQLTKALEKRSSKKMGNANRRFLKQNKYSNLIQPNSNQPSCSKATGFVSPKKTFKKTTTARRPTASSVKRLGSWSTISSGSDYTPITTNKATKTSSIGLKQSAGACKMKSAVKKLSETHRQAAPKTHSLLTITPAMWKEILAQQTPTSSDLPANECKESAKTTAQPTTTNSAELVAQIEKKKAPIESKETLEVCEPTAICTCNEPPRNDSKTSSSSEVILYYSNLPGQEIVRNTVVVEDDCAESEQYVEKKEFTNGKDTPFLLELPVWFMQAPAHKKSSKSSISSMNRHGANANGSAEPMAKKPLLSRSVITTSTRSLKRKSYSLDDGNVSSTKIPRLNIGMALEQNPAPVSKPQQHGFVSLLNDVVSFTLARPFHACKRLFTGEIKHSS